MGKVDIGQFGFEPFGVNMVDDKPMEDLRLDRGPAFPVTNKGHLADLGDAVHELAAVKDFFSESAQRQIVALEIMYSGDDLPERVDVSEELLVDLFQIDHVSLAPAREKMYLVMRQELQTDATNITIYGDLVINVAERLAEGNPRFEEIMMSKIAQIRVDMGQQGERVGVYKAVMTGALLDKVDIGMKQRLVDWGGSTDFAVEPMSRELGLQRSLTEGERFYGLMARDLLQVDRFRLGLADKLDGINSDHHQVTNLAQALKEGDAAGEL